MPIPRLLSPTADDLSTRIVTHGPAGGWEAATGTLTVVASLDNLTVTISDEEPSVVIAEGQIDSHTSTSLDDVLSSLSSNDDVAVNLSKVTFIDSSGLRVLVRAHKRQLGSGGRLTVLSPSEPVSRLFEITGLTSELAIIAE